MRAIVVDDQRSARHMLTQILGNIDEVTVSQASSLAEASALLQGSGFDIAFVDLRLGDDIRNRDGLVLIREICANTSITPVVVSGYGELAELRAAFQAGAHDYLIKETLCDELLRPLVESVRSKRKLESEVLALRAQRTGLSMPTNLVGSSKPMEELRSAIRRVVASDRPVLITGPTGSGKELVVQAIHALGPHPKSPLLDLNCSAFPDNLLESHLFGHEKGAFTGATTRNIGYLAAVRDGTLFLDEIGELELRLQAKLLRVLEAGTYRPVGAIEDQLFNGRVVAATHVDLAMAIQQRRFREDLFYRLNVLTLRVPSLDEHREDIPALVAHFLSRHPRIVSFADSALELLMNSSWPGNVRQLRNVIDRLSVMCEADVINDDDVRNALDPHTPSLGDPIRQLVKCVLQQGEGDKLDWASRVLVDEALVQAGGNKSAASRLLGVHRKVVERWLQRGDVVPSHDDE